MDWSELSKLFLVGAFPWISELKKLEIHYKIEGINISAIFNFFASLFAMGIFTYSYYANEFQLISFPEWWIFLIIAAVLTVVFFSLFIYYRKKVEEGKNRIVVIFSFVLYIFIFTSLTTCFGLLKVYKDHIVIKGKVVNAAGKGVAANFLFTYIGSDSSKTKEKSFKTSPDGSFVILTTEREMNTIASVQVKDDSGNSYMEYTDGAISVFTLLNRIKLKPQ